jgi:hypothetical protein
VKDLYGKENMALVETSFTTSIDFFHREDDDASVNVMHANVRLVILAYEGCDSAESCAASGITGSPLIPEYVEMNGWSKLYAADYVSGEGFGVIDDLAIADLFTSTNDANFILAGKGTGDIFLQAIIIITMEANAVRSDYNSISVLVNNWVLVVHHEECDMYVNEFQFPTASPVSTPP